MKTKLFTILVAMILIITLIGCKIDEDQAVIMGIETAAVVIGYYAAQQPDIDQALRTIYNVATGGELSPGSVNTILKRLDMNEPLVVLMVGRVLRLAEMVGATVIEGSITDMANIPPEFIKAISKGYVEGYNVFMLSVE